MVFTALQLAVHACVHQDAEGASLAMSHMHALYTFDYILAPGTSVKNMAKWAQAIRKSREQARPLFQKYDYGSVCHTRLWLPRNCNRR